MQTLFSFNSPKKLLFGPGSLARLADNLRPFGRHILLVTGQRSFTCTPRFAKLQGELTETGMRTSLCQLEAEPSPASIDAVVDTFRPDTPSAVVAIGGGSVLDGGKALAAMLTEEGSITDLLEGVGSRMPAGTTLPFIAVPTTAGTGSEATANAVITATGPKGFKRSLRHTNFIPDIAIVDPELTLSCPPAVSATCGMDCFTQLVEGYLSTAASRLTDTLALDGLRAIAASLEQVYLQPDSIGPRTDIAYAAYLSGIVLANSGLGTVHGLAGELGGRIRVAHGLVCARLMAPCNRETLAALRAGRQADRTALEKYATLGRLFAGDQRKSSDWLRDFFINELDRLSHKFQLPGLAGYGLTPDIINSVASKAANKNNPVTLGEEALAMILSQTLD